ncbi:hypothetical protein B0T19DRAFT_88424 [Cercophora scortea]|uniref:Secreted protein n=1 Tax=Cercophora scortea TaxID=314031 RepID=A0AAE0IVC9_9PEZI|nr:hypothetical protein B0T19DRAFT_88424 [Cercophora scortea]
MLFLFCVVCAIVGKSCSGAAKKPGHYPLLRRAKLWRSTDRRTGSGRRVLRSGCGGCGGGRVSSVECRGRGWVSTVESRTTGQDWTGLDRAGAGLDRTGAGTEPFRCWLSSERCAR